MELSFVYLHRGTASSFADQVEGRPVELAMIDGDHSYEGVRADIVALLPVMAAGAVLAGHDLGADFPGVAAAVRDTLGPDVWTFGKLWAFQL